MTIGDLEWSCRAYNCLVNSSFKDTDSIDRIAEKTGKELLRVKNLGIVTLREIQDALAYFGLYLRDYPYRYPHHLILDFAENIFGPEDESASSEVVPDESGVWAI